MTMINNEPYYLPLNFLIIHYPCSHNQSYHKVGLRIELTIEVFYVILTLEFEKLSRRVITELTGTPNEKM